MTRRFPLFFFLLCSLISITAYASATEPQSAARIRIENRTYGDGTLTFDVKLSNGNSGKWALAALFTESGRFKLSQFYTVEETVKMSLNEVDETDYVKVICLGNQYQPLADELLRMPGNGAQANEEFEKKLREALRDTGGIAEGAANGSSGETQPYALARLIVCCNALPNLDDFQVSAVVAGPDGIWVLQFVSPDEAEKCAEYLRTVPGVDYVEPDTVVYADASAAASLPLSWGSEDTHIREYAENLRQRGIHNPITVAVIDSGISEHDLFGGRIVSGYDFVEGDAEAQDECGHGSHVAGIIADCSPDTDVRIMPVRVLDAGGFGSLLNVSLGIRYAADHGANVINLSLSCADHAQFIDDAVNYALSKNITVSVAAGNKNQDTASCCPAHIQDCITVSAVNRDWKRVDFSNYGEAVDLCTPGTDIRSAWLNGGYREMSGTSMAAPYVSAAAALLMCERGVSQTPRQIVGALCDAAIPLDAQKNPYYGAGFLNLKPFVIRSQHIIRYDANGGTGSMGPQSAADGDTVTLKLNAFTRDDFDFNGWNTMQDGSGVTYQDCAAVTVSGDLSLYAQWKPKPVIFASLYDDGRMVFQSKPGDGTPRKTYQVSASGGAEAQYAKWFSERSAIQKAVFAEPIEPTSTSLWFYGCGNLTEVSGLENLRLGRVADMSQMFAMCDSLTELDLTDLDAGNVANMRQMFFGCEKLKKIYASDGFAASVTSGEDMFTGCVSLRGGQGTGYDENHTGAEYARIDGDSSAPGYFSRYTVSWNESPHCTITVSRVSSPKAGAVTEPLSNGDAVYKGDILRVSYAVDEGYTLEHGSEFITVSGNVTGDTIWASATENFKPYTVRWTISRGCVIMVSRESSPKAGAPTGILSSGDTIYTGDRVRIAYSAEEGYTLSGHGAESVTVSGDVTEEDIWVSATPNQYAYTMRYRTSNGVELGSDVYTRSFGTSETVTPPSYAGYDTPSPMTVLWEVAENREIMFTYSPTSVGFTTKTGRTCDEPLITFSAEVQYQNRTADSVQIRVVWTDTIQANGYDAYSQNLIISSNGVSAGTVTVAAFNLWRDSVGYERSSAGDTGWITVPAGARDTSVSVNAYHYQANYYGTNMEAYGVTPYHETWTIPIPVY